MKTIEAFINRAVRTVGTTGALVLPLLMLTILLNVALRYAFNIGSIELEELQWHLNAIVVMSCLAWAYQKDRHVRVDVLHNRMSPRARALIEIFGVLFLLLPFLWMVGRSAWTIFGYSWALKEGSPMPSGLPARYIVKFVMAAGLTLLGVQAIAILLASLREALHPGASAQKD
ncbi:TRAP transporter small permease subunit [Oceanicola sp. D3]|uniref:TRAP transporter small permease subunit n=1 Tax=Oceanicola sp. D3 TaxID=2587163 RepID=UPI0011216F46|nr:TRAP transporter small permease subunit [Oceanicola sp. D3]QDC10618.1 TRAP transporter small permease subunit [Oceanicola sp. D3]